MKRDQATRYFEPDAEACARARERLVERRHALVGTGGPEIARELARIDEALRWLDAGLYGRCSICLQALDVERILADPVDKVCGRCKAARGAKAATLPAARRPKSRIPTVKHRPVDGWMVSLRDGTEALNRQFIRASRVARSA